MKILYVSPMGYVEGHYSTTAIKETEALAEAGHDVTLLSFAGVLDENIPHHARHLTVVSQARWQRRLVKLNASPALRALVGSITILLTCIVAARLTRKYKIDVIHCESSLWFGIIHLQILGIMFKGQAWAVQMLAIPERTPVLKHMNRLNKIKTVYVNSFKKSKYVYLCSDSEVELYYNRFLGGVMRGRIYKVCPTVDPPYSNSCPSKEDSKAYFGITPGRSVFLSFGTPHPGKDVKVVLEALHETPGAVLLHGGKAAPKVARIFADSAEIVRGDYIFNNTYVTERDKPYYFRAADATILSYTADFTSAASMIWESCRFETPMIASDNPQISEIVLKYNIGLVFKAQDKGSLKQTISRFMSLSPDDINTFKKGCKAFTNDFSHQAWAKQMLEIYKNLLKQQV